MNLGNESSLKVEQCFLWGGGYWLYDPCESGQYNPRFGLESLDSELCLAEQEQYYHVPPQSSWGGVGSIQTLPTSSVALCYGGNSVNPTQGRETEHW